MLRLPPFRYHRPRSLDEAVGLLAEHGAAAMPIAGGTDLVPNMKHRLFTPEHLVALGGLGELQGIREEGRPGASAAGAGTALGAANAQGAASASGTAVSPGGLDLGAGETLSAVARNPLVRQHLPALADAAAHVAGPQLRNRGTLGGNLCLDTRCTYYNQTEFWRSALGYCLKKDGDVCHVTRVGKKCVAAHSADTPPVLMSVGATAVLEGPEGRREISVDDFFVADGIWNTRREPGELVTRIRVPPPGVVPRVGGAEAAGADGGTAGGANGGAGVGPPSAAPLRRFTAYAKMRQRKAVDFPLLTVAAAWWVDPDDRVVAIRGVVTGLGSRPRVLTGWDEIAQGEAAPGGQLAPEVVEALAERAHQQCHPLENMIVDPDWRRAMVPVFVRRALTPGSVVGGRAAAAAQ